MQVVAIHLLHTLSSTSCNGDTTKLQVLESSKHKLEILQTASNFARSFTNPNEARSTRDRLNKGPQVLGQCELKSIGLLKTQVDKNGKFTTKHFGLGLLSLMMNHKEYPVHLFSDEEVSARVLLGMLYSDEDSMLHPSRLSKVVEILWTTTKSSNLMRHHGTPDKDTLQRLWSKISQVAPKENFESHLPSLQAITTENIDEDERKNRLLVESEQFTIDPQLRAVLTHTPTKSRNSFDQDVN